MDRNAIIEQLRSVLIENFEVDPAQIAPEANLFEDLGLDSIDAVDLAIKVQQITGKRIKPEDFKHVRTLDDVVNTAEQLLAA